MQRLAFSKAEPTPTIQDPIAKLFVDPEAGREAFTYVLESGRGGTVHAEQVLEYNKDPTYPRDLLLYRLTLEAQKRVADTRSMKSGCSTDPSMVSRQQSMGRCARFD